MNVSRGEIADADCGSGAAATTYNQAKKLVTVSVTNRGDCPVIVEMKNRRGRQIARTTFAPRTPKVDRSGNDVKSVSLQWQGPGKCEFDYEISVS